MIAPPTLVTTAPINTAAVVHLNRASLDLFGGMILPIPTFPIEGELIPIFYDGLGTESGY